MTKKMMTPKNLKMLERVPLNQKMQDWIGNGDHYKVLCAPKSLTKKILGHHILKETWTIMRLGNILLGSQKHSWLTDG